MSRENGTTTELIEAVTRLHSEGRIATVRSYPQIAQLRANTSRGIPMEGSVLRLLKGNVIFAHTIVHHHVILGEELHQLPIQGPFADYVCLSRLASGPIEIRSNRTRTRWDTSKPYTFATLRRIGETGLTFYFLENPPDISSEQLSKYPFE